MNCSNCGNPLIPGDSFCQHCGAAAGMATPAYGTPAYGYSGPAPIMKQRLPHIITAGLFAFQLLCWFFNHFNVELFGFSERSVSMCSDALRDADWVFVFTFLFIPLTVAAIVVSVIFAASNVVKNRKPILFFIAGGCNLVAFFVNLLVYASHDTVSSCGLTFGGVLFLLFALLTIAAPILLPKLLQDRAESPAIEHEHTASYGSAFGHVAPAKSVPTVKCALCGYDVPAGNSYCLQCGTALNAYTPAAPVAPAAPAAPAYDAPVYDDRFAPAAPAAPANSYDAPVYDNRFATPTPVADTPSDFYGADDKTLAISDARGAAPGYGTPVAPGYGTPAAPGYGTPAAPGYGTPAAPGYGAPATPGGFIGKNPDFAKVDRKKDVEEKKNPAPNVWHRNSGF